MAGFGGGSVGLEGLDGCCDVAGLGDGLLLPTGLRLLLRRLEMSPYGLSLFLEGATVVDQSEVDRRQRSTTSNWSSACHGPPPYRMAFSIAATSVIARVATANPVAQDPKVNRREISLRVSTCV